MNQPMAEMLSSRDQQQLLQTLVKSAGGKKTLDIGIFFFKLYCSQITFKITTRMKLRIRCIS